MINEAREVEILLARIESAIEEHQRRSRDPDPQELERLQAEKKKELEREAKAQFEGEQHSKQTPEDEAKKILDDAIAGVMKRKLRILVRKSQQDVKAVLATLESWRDADGRVWLSTPRLSNDFETIDGFHGSEVCYLRMVKVMSQEDRILAKYIDHAKADELLKHAYSSRQLLKEVEEESPQPAAP